MLDEHLFNNIGGLAAGNIGPGCDRCGLSAGLRKAFRLYGAACLDGAWASLTKASISHEWALAPGHTAGLCKKGRLNLSNRGH